MASISIVPESSRPVPTRTTRQTIPSIPRGGQTSLNTAPGRNAQAERSASIVTVARG